MKLSKLSIGLAVWIALTSAAITRAATPSQAFAQGSALLAGGDFRGALQAYSVAVRADRTNQEYVQQFMLVRRVIALRESLGREKDLQRWQQTARALRSFYVSQRIYSEALRMDEQIHVRLHTGVSAAQLADTQLAMNRDAEAVQVLAALDPQQATPATQALLAVALARQDRTDEAHKTAQRIVLPDRAGPGTLYSLARMHAVLGNQDEALGLLARCFQAVTPSRLDDFKAHATRSPEFADLASTDGFARVLKTKSKVAESKCSGGSSCAGCPMRGKCPKSQGK